MDLSLFSPGQPAAPARPRITLVDAARGIAIVAMVIYHFSWDLSFFGLIETEVASAQGWRIFARLIAGSFLFLVGVGLVLAHGRGLRLRPFLRRLALLVAAALAVTLGTYALFPESFVFFGILHAIALTSVLGLAFLRLPWIVTLAAAAVAFALPLFASVPMFNAPGWLWLGLATVIPPTNDYVPLLPWFGCVLAGMALATAVLGRDPPPAWLGWHIPGPLGRALGFAGRHSLPIYLVHQLVLLGAVWAFVQVAQPARTTPFIRSCSATCLGNGADTATCSRYCGCVSESIGRLGLWEKMSADTMAPEDRQRLSGAIRQCRPGETRPTP